MSSLLFRLHANQFSVPEAGEKVFHSQESTGQGQAFGLAFRSLAGTLASYAEMPWFNFSF